jgi:hypothetical protein
MSDGKRRFDPSLLDGVPPPIGSPAALGAIGQLFGGIGAGLGQSIAQKMNDRVMVAAAALQGLLAAGENIDKPKDVARAARQYGDALLAELAAEPDPRNKTAAGEKGERASIGVIP